MKKVVIVVSMLIMSMCVSAQNEADTSSLKECAHATKDRDTLFVEESVYGIFHEVWDMPEHRDYKPVLVRVESLRGIFKEEE